LRVCLDNDFKLRAGGGPDIIDIPVVALVCSTGGIDALRRILTELSADLPAAVIVLQHLQPDHVSELPAILQRHTALKVVFAQDGERLAPGHVVVAPPGRHTLIGPDGSLALIPSGAVPPYRPSADLLLTTLAVAAGPRAIAVVLSGQGNDGATGASAVHRFGGVVIASSEATSARTSMPLATIGRDSAVDHVVALDEIAALLGALLL
jgi:two-component system chemotaxis response regulator CheB